MLSKTILSVFAFALAASASPVVNKRWTPAQTAQQECGNNFVASCCNQVTKQEIDGIPVNVGIDCVALNRESCFTGDFQSDCSQGDLTVLSLLGLSQLCTEQVACCQSGAQVSHKRICVIDVVTNQFSERTRERWQRLPSSPLNAIHPTNAISRLMAWSMNVVPG